MGKIPSILPLEVQRTLGGGCSPAHESSLQHPLVARAARTAQLLSQAGPRTDYSYSANGHMDGEGLSVGGTQMLQSQGGRYGHEPRN